MEPVAEVKNVVRNLITELDPIADDEGDRDDCPGTTGDGKYLKIRNGITIDSGAGAFVMPESWFPGVPTMPSKGSLAGQRFVGATGKKTANTGQKNLQFTIMSGQERRGTFQTSDVNTILASVGGIADGPEAGSENYIIFGPKGGIITPIKFTTITLSKDENLTTNFDRKGNVYVMDAWIKKHMAIPSAGDRQGQHFQGQAGM